ncbi:MAG: hypothetical protein H7A49_14260 [Akkermansiaceae bacterium]|nr:hypothetical protein [Akkermansiaceae bacterium]MCP5545057.1 hypothetical protein [Akkermansiaceae bacterium]MCP5546223.1 hypothetical protein [Akkermansiaceae bacterium]
MQPAIRSKEVTRISEIGIGLEESVVVQVEAGTFTGYLIAAAHERGELPSEIILRAAIYLLEGGNEIRSARADEVLVSCKNGWWCAVDLSTIDLIPCPSTEPYPVLHISKRGYQWMEETIRARRYREVLDHLAARFPCGGFTTDRGAMTDSGSPFCHARVIGAAFG